MSEKQENDKQVFNSKKFTAEQLARKYAPKAMLHAEKKEKLNEATFEFLTAELAENALSADIIGRPGSNLNLIFLEIDEVLSEEESIRRLKRAEMHFLETLESVKKLEALRKHEELEKTSDILRTIRLGVSRYNILFVITLIAGLAWSALNLPKESLALVSASIGGAITHLLSERNSVLAGRRDNARCNNCDEED